MDLKAKEAALIQYLTSELDKQLNMIKIKRIPKVIIANEITIPTDNIFVSFVGSSCCGKSTFVKQHFQKADSFTMEKFDADDLTLEAEKLGFSTGWQWTEYFLNQLENILKSKNDLTVVENNNITIDMRAKILNRMHPLYNSSILIGLNPSWEIIEEQTKARGAYLTQQEWVEKYMLKIQFSNPEKYFAGYDTVYIINEPRKAKVTIGTPNKTKDYFQNSGRTW